MLLRRRLHSAIRRSLSGGFTLVELVVVILILGILAGIAAPRLLASSRTAAKKAFVQHLKVCYQALERYQLDAQAYPANTPHGTLPTELNPYLQQNNFPPETPIGGRWDYHANAFGFFSAVGVVYPVGHTPPETTLMTEIDAMIDDGDLSTGTFRGFDGGRRFYWRFR